MGYSLMEWCGRNAAQLLIAVLLCGVIALQFEQLAAIKDGSFNPAYLGTVEVHVANTVPIAVDATVRNPSSTSERGMVVPLKVTTTGSY